MPSASTTRCRASKTCGFTAELNRIRQAEASSASSELLVEVGLGDARDQKAGTYSRGMKQRLGIADALLKRPEILILDEPTTAIDPEGVAEILVMIRSLADQQRVTVLLVQSSPASGAGGLRPGRDLCQRGGSRPGNTPRTCLGDARSRGSGSGDIEHRWGVTQVRRRPALCPRRRRRSLTRHLRDRSRSRGDEAIGHAP